MIHKKLLSLLVLLMTAASGAWATVYNGNAQVYSEDLKVGDIIYDASIYHPFKLAANRYTYQNTVQTVISNKFENVGVGNTGTIMTNYKPFTADGKDGNAWVVIEKMSVSLLSGEAQVLLGGIIYDPNSIYPDTDAETEGAAFTEATFTMPASDATVNYDIVRDMEDETYPVEFSGLAEKVVVKKKTGSDAYEPLTELNIQLIDQLAATDAQNIISADGIKVNVLKGTDNNGTITYDETNPIKYADFLDNMQPGLYKIVAEPTDATTSPYIGTASLEFEALAGYPVDVAANEYVTYYSATENLTVDDDDAQLYTITAVSGSEATAEEISGANKETPFLVYNSSDKDKTIILIPTDIVIAGQAHASEFVGTAEATTIAASADGLNNYAFNGKKFVWVMEPLAVAANKAWLAIPATPSSARVINLVFGDATAIGAVSGSPADNGDIYDLNGRKLDKKPTRKGVYIQNGRKVVIK